MGATTDIKRFLPNNEYQAAVNANAPTALNPFATVADVTAGDTNFANADLTLTGDRFHEGDGFGMTFDTFDHFVVTTDNDIEMEAGGLFDITSGGGNISLTTPITHALVVPKSVNPTANVTSPIEGMLKGNTTSKELEYYDGTSWVSLVGGGGGNTIYTADDTIGAGRLATLTDDITFKGATATAVDSFIIENSDNSHSLRYRNDGILSNTGSIIGGRIGTTGALFSSGRVFDVKGTSGNIGIFRPVSGNGTVSISAVGANDPILTLADNTGTTIVSMRSVNTSSITNGLNIGSQNPSENDKLHVLGGDVTFEGLTDNNLFFLDENLDQVNLATNVMKVSKVPFSNRNIQITGQNLAANGTGVIYQSTQALTGSLTGMQVLQIGATTGINTALALSAYNSTGTNYALNISRGDVIMGYSGINPTKVTIGGGYGRVASKRFEVVNLDNDPFETLYYSLGRQTAKNNYMFEAASSANQTDASKETVGFYGSLGGASTVNAEKYGYKMTMTPATGNQADMYGAYVHLSSSNNVTDTVTNYGYKVETYAGGNVTIDRGDFIGFEAEMGTSSNSQDIDSFVGANIIFANTVGSTIGSAVGLQIDMGNSESVATTAYAMTVLNGNSGFGIATPASMVTAQGDIEIVGGTNGVIFEDRTTSTRIRVFMDNGILQQENV